MATEIKEISRRQLLKQLLLVQAEGVKTTSFRWCQ